MSLFSKKNVVVPLDFSDESLRAVHAAVELADGPESVQLVHVVQPPTRVAYGFAFGPPISEQEHAQAVSKYFDEYVQEHGLAAYPRTMRTGDPGEEIATFAQEIDAGLIVIPSHGYHGLKRFMLGSVTERVLRTADCPILVMRRRDDEEE